MALRNLVSEGPVGKEPGHGQLLLIQSLPPHICGRLCKLLVLCECSSREGQTVDPASDPDLKEEALGRAALHKVAPLSQDADKPIIQLI